MFFNYFVPKDADINTCPHMVLIDNELEWDPYDEEMAANRPYGDNAVQVKSMTVGDKRRWVAVEHERDSCLGLHDALPISSAISTVLKGRTDGA